MIFVGPKAERRFGRRHFLELLSVFTSAPQFPVLYGRREIGNVDPFVLIRKVTGTRVISLAGRGWSVSAVDWSRRRAYVEPAETKGEARWISVAQPQSYVLVDAQRRVLIGAEPAGTRLSQRAQEQLPKVRAECADRVDHDHTLVRAEGARTRWWTWAGGVGDYVLIYVGQAAAAGDHSGRKSRHWRSGCLANTSMAFDSSVKVANQTLHLTLDLCAPK